MNANIFDKLDFGPFRSLLDNDDITDISFDNNGQIWIRSLTQGSLRVEVKGATTEFVEKLAFQCSNVMGTTFNNAKPFLDAESAELRLNFVHSSIATNGIAMVIRKTPAKIRLEKEKLINEDYFTQDIHDVLIKCVEGHCNIIVAGETGSGKTEFVKYLASHTKVNEKIITIEDTLELHLDKIFPQRDIVAMKTNNIASYTDVLVTCMRQNPKWILLSEVRSAEAVTAVRNSISSGHNILSTIHADKASAIPYRLYSLMETDLDVNQFLSTIYRYIQLGVHIRAYYSKERGKFHREVDEVVEFYVDENNQPQSRIIYQKTFGKEPIMRKPSKHLIEYLENQNIDITAVTSNMMDDDPFNEKSEMVGNESVEYAESGEETAAEEYQNESENYVEQAQSEEIYQEVEIDENGQIPASMVIESEEVPENQDIPLSNITDEVQAALTTDREINTETTENTINGGAVNQTIVNTPEVVYQQMPMTELYQQQLTMQQQPVYSPTQPVIPAIVNQPATQQSAPINTNQAVQPVTQQIVSPTTQQQAAVQQIPIQQVSQPIPQPVAQQPIGISPNGVLPFLPPTNGTQLQGVV